MRSKRTTASGVSEAEIQRVELSANTASAQSVSASDVSTTDIKILDNFNDVVKRYETFGNKLDVFFDTIPTVAGAVAGGYRVPLGETQYAGSVPLHLAYDYAKQLPVA